MCYGSFMSTTFAQSPPRPFFPAFFLPHQSHYIFGLLYTRVRKQHKVCNHFNVSNNSDLVERGDCGRDNRLLKNRRTTTSSTHIQHPAGDTVCEREQIDVRRAQGGNFTAGSPPHHYIVATTPDWQKVTAGILDTFSSSSSSSFPWIR